MRSIGPDGARPLTLEDRKRPVSARSRAVKDGRVEFLSLVSVPGSRDHFRAAGWPKNGKRWFSARDLVAGILRTRTLFFGCDRTSRRPLRGRHRISFREAEAPAEPYTTEKLATRGARQAPHLP